MKKGSIHVISAVSGALIGALAGAGAIGKILGKSEEKIRKMSDKHLSLFLMMNQWVKVKQDGKNLSEYFEKNKYEKIAIYGLSYAGETLLSELQDSSIQIAYGIDQNADSIYSDINVYSLEDSLEPVDVVVVTAITFFNEIEKKLSGKIDCQIISLEDILHEI